MKVAQRLYLAVLPSLTGVVLVAALAYWGQYARTVPEIFLAVAAVAIVGTLATSWVNVRYVAARVERLSHRHTSDDGGPSGRSSDGARVIAAADELDAIEGVFDNLTNAVVLSEHARERDARRYHEGTESYATLIASAATIAMQQLENVRLPLHILLENHFGELNENQEEMLGAARAAAERADLEFAALNRIAELDLGVRPLRRDRVYPADLLNAVRPLLQSIASHHGATLQADIAPLVPAISGDAAQLQEALAVLLGETVAGAQADDELLLVLADDEQTVQIKLTGAVRVAPSLRSVLAERVIQASGGTCERSGAGLLLTLSHAPFADATTGFSK